MTSGKGNPVDKISQSIDDLSRISEEATTTDICVVGGGFVGLVTAAGFAQFGHSVVCVENDPFRLAKFQEGRLPFFEKNLENLIKSNLKCGRLSFSNDVEDASDGRQAVFVTVGTPPSAGGRADLSALHGVIETLARALRSGQVIVLKSTVPVGTAKWVRGILAERGHTEQSVAVINNPEFLREGTAVWDFFHPKRIIIGGESTEAIEFTKKIYNLGISRPAPIIVTNNLTAEMIKYASNTFLATKIGFVNELAGLCNLLGTDIRDVTHAMGLDPRIGAEFLNPGPGWGGSCLPKDVAEFVGLAQARGMQLLIAEAVQESNQRQFETVVRQVKQLVGNLERKQIGVLGLSFKAGTSDMRGSPAIPIIRMMQEAGASIKAFDPAANGDAKPLLPGVEMAAQAFDVAIDADCIAVLTEWPEFQLLDWGAMGELMRDKNLVDARNLLTPEMAHRHGYNYISMGQA